MEVCDTDTPLMYNKFHSVFIKNEDDSMSDGITTVYSISKLDDVHLSMLFFFFQILLIYKYV